MHSRVAKSRLNLLAMAWRNIGRNRRRTGVTVGAMTLALTVLILYTGLIEGYLRNMERNILDLELGDVQIYAQDYREHPSIYTVIEDPDRLLQELRAGGFPASARLLAGCFVAAGESSAGAVLRGLEIENDQTVSGIGEHIATGEWLDRADPMGVVLGRRLAQTLAVEPGDELVILGQAADGTLANDLFTVRGILQGIGDDTDRGGVFVTDATFRLFFELPTGVHQIIVRRTAGKNLENVVSYINQREKGLDVKTWRELAPTLASILDSTRAMIQVVFVVVYLVVAILILNAMLMAVFERIREFGVLKAIGMSPGRVLGLILIESSFQVVLAVSIGISLSLPGLWYLTRVGIDTGSLGGMSVMGVAFSPIWKASVTSNTFLGPTITLILLAFFAVLYPALKAARITPVEAIHHY